MPAPAKAAPWVWALAGLTIVVGSCLGLSSVPFLASDPSLLRQAVAESNLPSEQSQVLVDNATALGVMFVVGSALLVALALLLALLGFAVRSGSYAGILTTRIVVGGLTLGLTGLALLTLLGAVIQAQPVEAVVTLLLFGTPALLGAIATLKLFAPADATPHAPGSGRADFDDEPWNAHLPPR